MLAGLKLNEVLCNEPFLNLSALPLSLLWNWQEKRSQTLAEIHVPALRTGRDGANHGDEETASLEAQFTINSHFSRWEKKLKNPFYSWLEPFPFLGIFLPPANRSRNNWKRVSVFLFSNPYERSSICRKETVKKRKILLIRTWYECMILLEVQKNIFFLSLTSAVVNVRKYKQTNRVLFKKFKNVCIVLKKGLSKNIF